MNSEVVGQPVLLRAPKLISCESSVTVQFQTTNGPQALPST